MIKSRKIKLEKFRVSSFVTELSNHRSGHILGRAGNSAACGYETDTDQEQCQAKSTGPTEFSDCLELLPSESQCGGTEL